MTSLVFLLAISGFMVFTSAMSTAKPEGCKRMTAALALGNDKYIFFGNTFIRLDDDFTQVEVGSSYSAFQSPYPEAAFIFSLDNTGYIFSDKYYFSAWTNYAPMDAEVFGGRTHGSFFKNGLDAAGNLNGTTVFIKDCQFVLALPYAPSPPTHLPAGIPCRPDAALTVGSELWLFKNDKLWKMTAGGPKAGMPIDTDSVIHLNDIKLCADGEVEA